MRQRGKGFGALEKVMWEKTGRYPSSSWGLNLGAMGVVIMLALAGCSAPGMFGVDDSPLPMPPPLEADADGVVPDNTGRNETETSSASQMETEEVSAAGAEESEEEAAGFGETAEMPNGYPELADVPQGPEATKKAESSPEAQGQREQLARELASDRERAKYSDEELRGGGIAPAEPPRPEPPAPPKSPRTEPVKQVEEPAPDGAAAQPAPEARPGEAVPVPQPPPPAPPVPQAQSAPVPSGKPAAVPAASSGTVLPTSAAPSGPRAAAGASAQTPRSYSSTTFEPSRAAPLPAEVSATLPPGVAQRYHETLGLRAAPPALPVTPALRGSGSFPGAAPYASIPFASGSAQLSGGDRRAIQQVAEVWQSRRAGSLRVVGHASSSAATRSATQKLIGNWQISQARATAVADALIQNGVDPGVIVIEAVGDSQSGADTSYGAGEAADRRVDLFLE